MTISQIDCTGDMLTKSGIFGHSLPILEFQDTKRICTMDAILFSAFNIYIEDTLNVDSVVSFQILNYTGSAEN